MIGRDVDIDLKDQDQRLGSNRNIEEKKRDIWSKPIDIILICVKLVWCWFTRYWVLEEDEGIYASHMDCSAR